MARHKGENYPVGTTLTNIAAYVCSEYRAERIEGRSREVARLWARLSGMDALHYYALGRIDERRIEAVRKLEEER